jgi:hypothetical protein
VRIEDLIEIWESVSIVPRQEVVKMRRPAPPVPENEQRRWNRFLHETVAVPPLFEAEVDRIAQARTGCDQASQYKTRVNCEAVGLK